MRRARALLRRFIEYERSYIAYRERRLSFLAGIAEAERLQAVVEGFQNQMELDLVDLFNHIPAAAHPSGLGLFAICFGRWTSDEADDEGNYKFLAVTDRTQPLTPNSRFDDQTQG